jgi:hypothetical protein
MGLPEAPTAHVQRAQSHLHIPLAYTSLRTIYSQSGDARTAVCMQLSYYPHSLFIEHLPNSIATINARLRTHVNVLLLTINAYFHVLVQAHSRQCRSRQCCRLTNTPLLKIVSSMCNNIPLLISWRRAVLLHGKDKPPGCTSKKRCDPDDTFYILPMKKEVDNIIILTGAMHNCSRSTDLLLCAQLGQAHR